MKDRRNKEIKEGKPVIFVDGYGEMQWGTIYRLDEVTVYVTIERDDNLGLYTRGPDEILIIEV